MARNPIEALLKPLTTYNPHRREALREIGRVGLGAAAIAVGTVSVGTSIGWLLGQLSREGHPLEGRPVELSPDGKYIIADKNSEILVIDLSPIIDSLGKTQPIIVRNAPIISPDNITMRIPDKKDRLSAIRIAGATYPGPGGLNEDLRTGENFGVWFQFELNGKPAFIAAPFVTVLPTKPQ